MERNTFIKPQKSGFKFLFKLATAQGTNFKTYEKTQLSVIPGQ